MPPLQSLRLCFGPFYSLSFRASDESNLDVARCCVCDIYSGPDNESFHIASCREVMNLWLIAATLGLVAKLGSRLFRSRATEVAALQEEKKKRRKEEPVSLLFRVGRIKSTYCIRI